MSSAPLTTIIGAFVSWSSNPALIEARTAFWQTRYELAGTMIERAVARGELPATVDGRLVLQALIAPLHFRTLLTDEPPDADFPRRLADLVLDGVKGRSPNEQRSTKR